MTISDFFDDVLRDIDTEESDRVEMVVTATLNGRPFVWVLPTGQSEDLDIGPFVDLARAL